MLNPPTESNNPITQTIIKLLIANQYHGNFTPAWFSSSRTLCQRCYIITRTKAVRKYHYHDRKVMAAAFAVSC